MDERTLNDLLECSVCLERLDESSKVLPCQHTFCRKCLEVIVSSRQELRCPECRILVDTKIDELPSNILLIRILEGMKNATQNQNNIAKSARSPVNGSVNTIVTELNNCEINESTKLVTNEPPTARPQNEQNVSNRRIVPHAVALYDFLSKKTGDLNFKKGDIILLKRKLDMNWCIGEINGREGAIPMNYVQVIVPLPVPQCIALYDFKMGPNEEEGCLTFKKGTIINVLRRVDHNWAEGCIGTCIGIFPIAFVEMNPLAKQIMESSCLPSYASSRILPQVPFDNVSSDSSSMVTTSPNSTCSSNTSTNSIPSSPISQANSPQNNASAKNYTGNKEKRHSLNALTSNTALSVVQSNRHSAEILTIPEPTEQSSQGTSSSNDEQTSNNTTKAPDPSLIQHQQHTARANVLKTNIHQNQPSLPWAYVALYPYKPRKSDELELKKGCVYFVTERCLDGWYKGKNWADKSGVFPGNYVTPLRNRDQQQLIHQRKSSHNPLQSPQTVPTMSQNANAQDNSNNQGTQTSIPPPELPPRSNTMTSGSVWAKPLGQHVEAFLNKKFSSNTPRSSNETKPSNTTQKHNNMSTNSSSKCTQPANQTNNISQHNSAKEKEKEKKEHNSSSAVSLMKRLTNMKRSKSPPNGQPNHCTYSMDNPVFEDICNQALLTKHSPAASHHIHVRSGSCPSQLLQIPPIEVESASTSSGNSNAAFGSQRIKGPKERSSLQGVRQSTDANNARNNKEKDHSLQNKSNGNSQHKPITSGHQKCSSEAGTQMIHHRKSQSLDANTISSQIANSSLSGIKSHIPHARENSSRFRCIVAYPPNSNVELELNVGDIVYVHRKLKDGWYKGTHARTNKTGLFPASFVEPDI